MTESPSLELNSAPPVKRLKLFPFVILLALLGSVGCVWLYNHIELEKPLQIVLVNDPRNKVVKAHAHFDGWINPNVVVFDIVEVSSDATRLDVFRLLLQYSESLKDQRFKSIILSARGHKKFVVDGAYFQQVGREYKTQNPMYTIRTFPLHLTGMDGSKPFSEYSGGMFAVLKKEMDQFTEFHDKWYVQEFSERK